MQQVNKVINKEQKLAANDGTVETRRVQTVKSDVDPKVTIANIIWYIYGLIAIILAFRFVLKLAGANAGNAFVNFIYTVSKIFSAPFDTIFGVTTASSGTVRSVFEPSILIAIAVYALIAWGLAKLFTLNEPQD
ncbi:YggT family protein [Candidatus Saccharibacteria bacterium]|nr:MAG: YggT family protein [Candidatus Saccharibacteria bacterium]TXG76090.1 MAG: YggT family protein [Patescibacteria group bacterium]